MHGPDECAFTDLIFNKVEDIFKLQMEVKEGYSIFLIVGFNKKENEFIIKTPYAWFGKVDKEEMYISCDKILNNVQTNCIIYTKTDINK